MERTARMAIDGDASSPGRAVCAFNRLVARSDDSDADDVHVSVLCPSDPVILSLQLGANLNRPHILLVADVGVASFVVCSVVSADRLVTDTLST